MIDWLIDIPSIIAPRTSTFLPFPSFWYVEATSFRLSSWRILAGGSAGSGGGISAGVAAWWGMSVPLLSNQGLAQTLHLLVVPRAEAVDWSSFCCCSSCGNEVVIWGDLLLVVDNTALVARPYD